MSHFIRCVMTTLSSFSLILLATLPAAVSHPIHTVWSSSQAVGDSQQWRGSRGTVVVDWPLTLNNSRSQQRGAISGLLRLGEDLQRSPSLN